MPIYEYRCTECGFELEKLQKLNDPPLTDCPECKKAALRKKVSAAGFRLKGSGWYETDFKKDNKKNLAESGTPDKTSEPAKPVKESTDKVKTLTSTSDSGS